METKIYILLIGALILSLFIVGCGKQSAEDITGGAVVEESVVAEEPVVAEENVSGLKIHTVKMTESGFVPGELTIAVGDTVEWVASRRGALSKAMVIGTRQCRYVKSKIFDSGETFSHTFEKADECNIIDGILTTAMPMKVFIE